MPEKQNVFDSQHLIYLSTGDLICFVYIATRGVIAATITILKLACIQLAAAIIAQNSYLYYEFLKVCSHRPTRKPEMIAVDCFTLINLIYIRYIFLGCTPASHLKG